MLPCRCVITGAGTDGRLLGGIAASQWRIAGERGRLRRKSGDPDHLSPLAAGIALAKKRGVYKGRKKGTTKLKPEKVLEMRETLKPRQIAKLMDATAKTVYNTLKRATKRLTEKEPAE